MKILLVGPLPPPVGGMSVFIEDLINSTLSKRVSIELLNTAVTKFFFNHPHFRFLLSCKFYYFYLIKMVTFKPEIVHINTSANLGFWEKTIFIILSKLFRKKTVLHIHGSTFDVFFNSSRQKSLIKIFINLSDKVIVLSEQWMTFFRNFVSENKLRIVQNGINLELYYHTNRAKKEVKVLFAGEIGKRKGIYVILEAIKCNPLLQAESIQFYFLGKSLDDGTFKTAVSSYKKSNIPNVHFEGVVTGQEKYKYFSESDIFILPSYAEGLPIALLEAMASSLPVISTEVGGIPDLVKPENGILIKPGNSDELGKALLKLLNDPLLREEMGKKNRDKIRNLHSLNMTVNKLLDIYAELLTHSN